MWYKKLSVPGEDRDSSVDEGMKTPSLEGYSRTVKALLSWMCYEMPLRMLK